MRLIPLAGTSQIVQVPAIPGQREYQRPIPLIVEEYAGGLIPFPASMLAASGGCATTTACSSPLLVSMIGEISMPCCEWE
jgi:hypothetical protein